MIATPCYGGQVHEPYMRGIMSLLEESIKVGMRLRVETITDESLITRARNEIVARFMASDCTHLFFIDADTDFRSNHVFDLLEADEDIVIGACPFKNRYWEKINIQPGQSPDQIRRMTIEYVLRGMVDSESGNYNIHGNLMEIADGGSGFMCIKRHAIEKVIAANPNLEYLSDRPFASDETDNNVRYAIFDTLTENNGRYLSEDYAFCRRWQELGGKVWLHMQVSVGHCGLLKFGGYKPYTTA